MCIARDIKIASIKGKLSDCDNQCMFVGYSKSQTGDVYRLYDLKIKNVIQRRDVIWLGKLYGE